MVNEIEITYNKTPTNITFLLPNFVITKPVKKDGANIAIICHWITVALASSPNLQTLTI